MPSRLWRDGIVFLFMEEWLKNIGCSRLKPIAKNIKFGKYKMMQ